MTPTAKGPSHECTPKEASCLARLLGARVLCSSLGEPGLDVAAVHGASADPGECFSSPPSVLARRLVGETSITGNFHKGPSSKTSLSQHTADWASAGGTAELSLLGHEHDACQAAASTPKPGHRSKLQRRPGVLLPELRPLVAAASRRPGAGRCAARPGVSAGKAAATARLLSKVPDAESQSQACVAVAAQM
mmetsp:Transcript_24602/g.77317  ORF Transcript_24602/g.77317 Transcript_24602/m.77317 type:complete len:192 (+) Transcript_24602:619-1194(+)